MRSTAPAVVVGSETRLCFTLLSSIRLQALDHGSVIVLRPWVLHSLSLLIPHGNPRTISPNHLLSTSASILISQTRMQQVFPSPQKHLLYRIRPHSGLLRMMKTTTFQPIPSRLILQISRRPLLARRPPLARVIPATIEAMAVKKVLIYFSTLLLHRHPPILA